VVLRCRPDRRPLLLQSFQGSPILLRDQPGGATIRRAAAPGRRPRSGASTPRGESARCAYETVALARERRERVRGMRGGKSGQLRPTGGSDQAPRRVSHAGQETARTGVDGTPINPGDWVFKAADQKVRPSDPADNCGRPRLMTETVCATCRTHARSFPIESAGGELESNASDRTSKVC